MPNIKSFFHELGCNSAKAFSDQYEHYLCTGDASVSAKAGGRQGTVILRNAYAKQQRKVATEAKSRKQEEKVKSEELERERKAAERESLREQAIGVRRVYSAAATLTT